MDNMKYSLFNKHLQEAIAFFKGEKEKIIRWVRDQKIIQRCRKLKDPAILYHAVCLKIVNNLSYEKLAEEMTRVYNVQMYPNAWVKWLRKVAEKFLAYANLQVRKALKGSSEHREFAVDATRLPMNGTGEVARIHTVMQTKTGLAVQTEVTDQHGAESATRVQVQKDALYLCDRAYGRSSSIAHFAKHGGKFVVRISPSQIRLYSDENCKNKIQVSEYLTDDKIDLICWCRYKKETYKLRLVGRVLPEEKQLDSESRARRDSARRGHAIKPETILYSRWLLLGTSQMEAEAEEILEKYKERWQIEMFFKRGKSVLKFRKLPYSGEKYRATEITLWLFVVKMCSVAVFRFLQTNCQDFSPYKLFSLAKDCLA